MSGMEPVIQRGRVCVTGATGYIATFIIKRLLEKGYKIRGTVRCIEDHEKVAPLIELQRSENLELVEVDLATRQDYCGILEGCDGLIHTATPIHIFPDGSVPFETVSEMQSRQIDPALNGTRDLLEGAAKSGVKRVVLTSSTAAIACTDKAVEVLDESCWSDVEYCRSIQMTSASGAYCLAKTLQEKLAWDLSEKLGVDLVTVNPSFVLGPSLSKRVSVSLEFIGTLAKGGGMPMMKCRKGTVPDGFVRMVDVRDVAEAHVAGLEKTDAHGRYMLLTNNIHCSEVAEAMREADERFGATGVIAVDSVDGKRHAAIPFEVDNRKAESLGITGYNWRETVEETAKALARNGFV